MELPDMEAGGKQPSPTVLGTSMSSSSVASSPMAMAAEEAEICDRPRDKETSRFLEFEKAGGQKNHLPPMPAKAEAGKPANEADPGPMLFGVSMKWISLAALTLQTSGQALLIKWSKAQSTDDEPYISSTAVFFTEVVKFFTSLLLVVHECGGVHAAAESLTQHFMQSPMDLLKAAVPSLIYTVQNNLMFYSFEKLSAPVQQVLYQMKIITTAGIGVIMLGKKLSSTQWSACVLLASGVAMVQWPRETDEGALTFGPEQVKGFAAVLSACCTSGFAGVWIQKMLQQTSASIWVRNVQLALFGSAMSIIVAMVNDGERIVNSGGMTQGYNIRVVSVILMTAFGGLLCAVMLKYAGATHGCFSTALSIILTSLLSQVLLGDFRTDFLFCVGAATAVSASLLFSLGLPEGLLASAASLLRSGAR